MPIRFISIILELTLMYILIKPFSICLLRPPNKPMNIFFYYYSSLVIKSLSRLILFSAGFFWIKKTKIKFDEEKYPKLRIEGDLKDSTIIISNHVAVWDMFIHAMFGHRSFVGKHTL